MMNEQRSDDVRNLLWMGGSALAGVLITAAFVSAGAEREHHGRYVVVEREVRTPHVISGTATPLTSNGRLYGRVLTRDGEEHVGFIRWDRNEGSWADVLDATKEGSSTRSGIRFGHIQRIDVAGRSRAILLLRSGQLTEMSSRSSDLGTNLRALTVEDPAGAAVELSWRELSSVEFLDAPPDVTPAQLRLHGTLTTADGQSFTGFIAWDVDEIYSTDLLEGDDDGGRRVTLSFGDIQSIARNSDASARVVLGSGGQMILDGTNDVDSSIRGITVSDPNLGEVKVDWDGFREVRFHAPDPDAPAVLYDGGRRMRGTVVTRSGEAFTGSIRWDQDESHSWEILNGNAAGAELQVELGRVATITREGRGVVVQLLDGRTLRLDGSNDVDPTNKGVVIEDDLGAHRVDWSDFVELRLEP
jgi:hypothetical protein